MDLHRVSANRFAGFDLTLFGIDEQAYVDTSILEASDGFHEFSALFADNIETAFSGKLLSLLGNEASVIRAATSPPMQSWRESQPFPN